MGYSVEMFVLYILRLEIGQRCFFCFSESWMYIYCSQLNFLLEWVVHVWDVDLLVEEIIP